MLDSESAERAEQTSAKIRSKRLCTKRERLHRNCYGLQTLPNKTGMHVSIVIAYSSSLVLILWIITASELMRAAVMYRNALYDACSHIITVNLLE
jgi:hypothetical protein